MSHITSLLTRPSTLGFVAVASSGAFYIGLKSKTITAQKAQREKGDSQGVVRGSASKEMNYGVKAGREGGGV